MGRTLRLRREVLVALDPDELSAVAGGGPAAPTQDDGVCVTWTITRWSVCSCHAG